MRKNLKKYLAGALAAIMAAGTLVACAGGDAKTGGAAGSSAVGESSAAGGESTDLAAYFAKKDHYTLKLMFFGDGDEATLNAIEEKLNVITEPALNANVELTRVGFGAYMQQLNLMLSSGDEFDLFVPMASPLGFVNAGQVQPVDALLPKFAPNALSQIQELAWVTQVFAGETYGLPNNGVYSQQLGVGMRKDIADELGIDYANMKTWDDYHAALVKVKEAYPDMYPLASNGGNMFGSNVQYTGQDSAGDTYNLAVLDDPFGNAEKIVSWFDTEQFKEVTTRMYGYAQEGLIQPDASASSDDINMLVSSGKVFSYFQHMKPGWEVEQTQRNGGKETVSWRYTEPQYIGSTVAWLVPTNSGDPERAVAFWDLMYTNKEVANLLINGIEGMNYKFVDEAKGIITFADGEAPGSQAYSRLPWAWPNAELGYFWDNEDTELWKSYAEFDVEGQKRVSGSFGFVFDDAPVMNEVTACVNVYQKYVPALLAGSLDPETTIPVLQEEMKKAGIEIIVAEKQAQYDTFRASGQK